MNIDKFVLKLKKEAIKEKELTAEIFKQLLDFMSLNGFDINYKINNIKYRNINFIKI